MSKSNASENDYLKLIYQAVAIANVADNAASAPLTNIYWALHSADPGEAGDQTTSEIAYTSYARVAVARTAGGHVVTGNSMSPAANVTFPECTGGSATATHFSTGVAASGASKIFHKGVIGSKLGAFTGATTDTITIPGLSGVAVNDRIAFYPVEGSGLPTGVTEGTVYFVLTVASDAITISTTQGGATLDITAAGDGVAFKVTPIVITSSPAVTPQLKTTSTILED